MGANAQTSVPLFVANQVLTASQQNLSAATGVPVFATTVTRDAAFGGSNKALAEGQLCYIEASDIVQYYTGSAWATVGPSTASGVVQVKNAGKATAFSTTSGTFVDVTDLTISITPTLNTNKILVIMTVQLSNSGGDGLVRLMRDSTAIGVSTVGSVLNGVGLVTTSSYSLDTIALAFLDSPATTSATTYKVQAVANGGTSYINRRPADTAFGGFSSITVMEVTP